MKWLNRSNVRISIYPLLLFLITFTIPFGFYFFPFSFNGIHLFGYRIVLLISIGILLLNRDITLYSGKASKFLFILLSGWIVFAGSGYVYAYDQGAILKEVSLLLSGFALIIVYQSLLKHTPKPGKILLTAWLSGLSGQLVITLYEMFYGKHLSGNFLEVLSKYRAGSLVRLIPAGTFDNPNNLAIYLLISILFLFYLIITQKNNRIFFVLLLTLSVLVIFNCHSRIGLMVLIIMSLAFLLALIYPAFTKFLKMSRLTFLSIGIGILSAFSIMNYNGMRSSSIVGQGHIVTDEIKSDNVRKGLIYNGIDFFIESKGLGIGAGNFESYIRDGKGKHPTDEIINSHNWPIQLLSQYGIFVLPALLAWLGYVFFITIKRIRETDPFSYQRRLLIPGLILIIIYLPISIMPSNFLPNPLNWFMLAFIAILADNSNILRIHED